MAVGVGVAVGKKVDLDSLAAGCPGPAPGAGVALGPPQAAKLIRVADIKRAPRVIFFGILAHIKKTARITLFGVSERNAANFLSTPGIH